MKIPKEDLKNYVGKKIRSERWISGDYLTLNYVGDYYMVGKIQSGTEDAFTINERDWYPYEEPKQKVKMWQALVILSNGQHSSTNAFYKSVDHYDSFNGHVGKFIKLLPHTEIEVEV